VKPNGGSVSTAKDLYLEYYPGGSYDATTTTLTKTITIYPNTLTSGLWGVSGAIFSDDYLNVCQTASFACIVA
jgi:hypothetical protein